MTKIWLLVAGLMFLSCGVLAGEVITNDTGEDATGLRVSFSTPVLITAFGDILTSVDPQMLSFEFVFSGGAVEPWESHWFNYAPATASVMESEWISEEPTPSFDGRDVGELVVLEEAVYEYDVTLSSDDGSSSMDGIVTCYIRQTWPFSVRFSADFEDAISYEWELAKGVLQGADVSFSLPDLDSNYKWLTVQLNMADGSSNAYHWEYEFPVDIFNKTNVVLDATQLVPANKIASVSWTAWNMVDEDPESFPIVEPSEVVTTISTYWPNVINVQANITTTDGKMLSYQGEILFFERDENPVPLRGVVATQSANFNTDPIHEIRRIWVNAFNDLEQFGANALQHHNVWYLGMPIASTTGTEIFKLEPLYSLPSGIRDPRGATTNPERLGTYLDAGRERGFNMIIEQRLEPYQGTDFARIESFLDQAGYIGSEEEFLQRWGDGFLYSAQGLWNMFQEIGQLAISHQAAGLILECATNNWVQYGGATYREFYTDLLEDLRKNGYEGFMTWAPNFAFGMGLMELGAGSPLLNPSVSGIPFYHPDMSLSVTLYPSLEVKDSAPMDEIYRNALDYLTRTLLPLSAAYGGKPIYIEDMQCAAVEGAVADPLNSESDRSEFGQVKWFWAMWRAISELNRTNGLVFSGITSAYYALIPDSWRSPDSPSGYYSHLQTQIGPFLDLSFNEYLRKALGVFYADRGQRPMVRSAY